MLNKKYLRTFDNYCKLSFDEDVKHKNNISKNNIDSPCKKTIFTLDNVLTISEAESLIKQTKSSYVNLDKEYLTKERDSHRVLCKNDKLATIIYDRIKNYIPNSYNNKSLIPCGFGIEGTWRHFKINNCFRFCKYLPLSNGFMPHRDATYLENENMRSILTIIIYLSKTKACTIFHDTIQERKIYQTVKEEMNEGSSIYYKCEPSIGKALIFNHDLIHSGEPLTEKDNIKYILRSDIVYVRKEIIINKYWLSDPYFLETVKLYREAFNRELDGDIISASLLYQKAVALRQFH